MTGILQEMETTVSRQEIVDFLYEGVRTSR